jgi:ferredoxin
VAACTDRLLSLDVTAGKKSAVLEKPELCDTCGRCLVECPFDAIRSDNVCTSRGMGNLAEGGSTIMYLIQILLPLYDNDGRNFPQEEFVRVRDELTERYGGITTYVRSPAEGLWKDSSTTTVHDDIVIYEVMTDHLDRPWWRWFREELARRFRQDVLIVRVSEVQLL